MLTKTKEEIAHAVYDSTLLALKRYASTGWPTSNTTIMGQLIQLIAIGVEAGISEALKHQYLNEDFNQDIGL